LGEKLVIASGAKQCGKIYPTLSTARDNTLLLPGGTDFVILTIKVLVDYIFIIRRMQHHFIKKILSFFIHFFVVFTLSLVIGCGSKSESYTTPSEYNLNRPSTIKLPEYLNEISGVAYYPKDKSVFAISDEKAWLYKIFLSGGMEIEKWKFSDKADYEDIVLVDSTFYVLQSKGNIISLRFVSPDSIDVKEYKLQTEGKNEFEILYFDKDQNRLVLLCKDCETDDKNSLTAWGFDLASSTFSKSPAYVIDVKKIEDLMQEKKLKFKPSAAAIHPLTGQLYIISSVNKVLVVADKNGTPQKIYRLNPELYKQPEGLTFSPEGHLIISNESGGTGAANIEIFKYNKAG